MCRRRQLPQALFDMGSYARQAGPRLCGMLWGAEDLATDVGARSNRLGAEYAAPFALARSLCLFAAAAAHVPAIDAVFVLTNLESHLEYAAMALKAGKHVLVEKPVGVSVAEIEEMNRLAKAKNLVCLPGHNYVYEAGMVSTVETRVRWPGKVGYHMEDLYLVTEGAPVLLSDAFDNEEILVV